MRKWLSIVLASSVLLTIPAPMVLAKGTDSALSKAIERRMDMGLQGDAALVQSYIDNDIYSEVWNIYMTEQEEQGIWDRSQKQAEGMPLVDAFLERNPAVKQNIKDRYISQREQGTYYLVLKDKKHESVATLKEFITEFDVFPIKISDKRYSERELSKMAEVFWHKKGELEQQGIEVTSINSLLMEQVIVVGIKENKESLEKNKEKLLRITGIEKGLLQVSFNNGASTELNRGIDTVGLMEEDDSLKTLENKPSQNLVEETEKSWFSSIFDFFKNLFT